MKFVDVVFKQKKLVFFTLKFSILEVFFAGKKSSLVFKFVFWQQYFILVGNCARPAV